MKRSRSKAGCVWELGYQRAGRPLQQSLRWSATVVVCDHHSGKTTTEGDTNMEVEALLAVKQSVDVGDGAVDEKGGLDQGRGPGETGGKMEVAAVSLKEMNGERGDEDGEECGWATFI